MKAFRATLEEVAEATLILHVVDVASPQATAHTAHVLEVLSEIGASGTPQLLVLNKSDLLAPEDRDPEVLRQRLLGDAGGKLEPRAVLVAGSTGEGMSALLEAIDSVLAFDPVTQTEFQIPNTATASIALLHEHARILEIRYVEDLCVIDAIVSESLRQRLARFMTIRPE